MNPSALMPTASRAAFYGLFVFIVAAIFLSVSALPAVQDVLARPLVGAIAFAATGLIDFFGGTIARDGNVLTDTATGATVHVTQACDGLGVFAVFAAMIVGLCRSVKTSLAAIATLFVAMQVFNLIRVIALFHLRSAAHDVYDVSHLFIMPWTTALIGWLIVWRVWARAR